MEKKYNLIQSLIRGVTILELIAAESGKLGVTAIATRVGLHKSTCFGLLYTLQHLGYVQQNPDTGYYSLGLKAFELGQAYSTGLDLRHLAQPFLQQLVETTQETVHLVVLEGSRAVYIDKVEGPHAMTISSRVGQEAKLHCTGVGKALLAHLPESEQRRVLDRPLTQLTEHTITDSEKMLDHLRQINSRGYSIDDQEIEIGLRCVAAPIFNARGEAMAAISLSGPISRITDTKLEEHTASILEATRAISRQLGYRP